MAILGRVHIDSPLEHATDPADRQRHRRHRRLADELAVFLLSRPHRSARREQIEDALWYGEPVNAVTSRGVVTGLRARLGTQPDGTPWLSDTGGRPGAPYHLHPGVLFDWNLFTRLRERAARHTGTATAAGDLHAALRLVRGLPFDDAKDSTGHRQTYTWLPESPIGVGRIVPAITDVAHRLAQHHLTPHLTHADTAAVRWAVNQGWLADPHRGTDEMWLDLMRADKADQPQRRPAQPARRAAQDPRCRGRRRTAAPHLQGAARAAARPCLAATRRRAPTTGQHRPARNEAPFVDGRAVSEPVAVPLRPAAPAPQLST